MMVLTLSAGTSRAPRTAADATVFVCGLAGLPRLLGSPFAVARRAVVRQY